DYLESVGPTKDPDRFLRLEFRRMARCFLSAGTAVQSLVGILFPSFFRGRNRFHILSCPRGGSSAAMGGTYPCVVSVRLQAAARDHSHPSAQRLSHGTHLFFPRDRTARPETSGHPDSTT